MKFLFATIMCVGLLLSLSGQAGIIGIGGSIRDLQKLPTKRMERGFFWALYDRVARGERIEVKIDGQWVELTRLEKDLQKNLIDVNWRFKVQPE